MSTNTANRRGFLFGGAATAAATFAAGANIAAAQAPARPFAGKVALVTGAARGIGRAIAIEYAKRGANVAMIDVANPAAFAPRPGFRVADMSEFDAAVAAASAHGTRILKIQADVRDLAAMRAATDRSARELGGLDFVVANAGFVAWHANETGAERDFVDVVDVNIHGVWKTVQPAIPHLKARGGGRIVTIASIGGRAGFAGNGIYTATKWAVIGLTKQMAMEFGPANIAVNAVSPGPVNTPMYRSQAQIASMGLRSAAEQDAALNPLLPLGDRPAMEPEEIADAVMFLSSEQAKAISGVALDVALGFNASYTA
ncbi:MAG: SDR family oxidoreductase [Tagaea sp.]|nr:SDR family oxidoreductase [Tagaea sp.]